LKNKTKNIESESDLNDETPLEVDSDVKQLQNDIMEMKNAHNGFVKAMSEQSQKMDQILQMIIRPPEQPQDEIKTVVDADGKPIEKRDPRSDGIAHTMNKKMADASLAELVQAGDLALRVHDRRQGLTDLEEFMVGVGKQNMIGFGQAQSHKMGVQNT